MRIVKIDYEKKEITLDGAYDMKVGEIISVGLEGEIPTPKGEIYTFNGTTLREGPTWIADGIDENGNLINPRLEEGPAPCEAGPTD